MDLKALSISPRLKGLSLLSALVLLVGLVVSFCLNQVERLHLLRLELNEVAELSARKNLLKQKQSELMRQYALANPLYVEKELGGFIPLKAESEVLQTLRAQDALKKYGKWRLREAFLQNNRLQFQVQKTFATKAIEEEVLDQIAPLEIGLTDMEQILTKIEGVRIGPHFPPAGRPDLLIKKCQVIETEHEGVYAVSFELVKRQGVKKDA